MLDANNALDALNGVITSILGGFLTTCKMQAWQKQGVVLAIAVLFGLARCYLTGQFTDTSIAAAIVVVVATAWTSYQTFLKDLVKQLQASGPVKSNSNSSEAKGANSNV